MPGTVIGTSMNIGYPGDYARNGDCVIANRPVKSTDTANINFGDPVVINSDSTGGTYSQVAGFIANGGTFAQAVFGGFAVREVKSFESYFGTGNAAPNWNYYAPGAPCDVIKRGCVIVKVNVGTPEANGSVYVRVAANVSIPAGVVGGIEAAADGANTVQLTNCRFFTGVLDGNNCAEVELIGNANA
jgi:hypothetical protein